MFYHSNRRVTRTNANPRVGQLDHMAAFWMFLRYFHTHLLGGSANLYVCQQCRKFPYCAGMGLFIYYLLCWHMFLLCLVYSEFLSQIGWWILSKAFSACIKMIMSFEILYSMEVLHNAYGFAYFELSLYPWNEPIWLLCMIFLTVVEPISKHFMENFCSHQGY